MELLHGMFFDGKGKALWKCATKSLLWDLWRKRISQCLNISLSLVVPSEFYSNTKPLDGLQIIQILFGWLCGEGQSLPIALRFLLGSVEVYKLPFLPKKIITVIEW